MDADQRYILDLYVKYARLLKLTKNKFCPFPKPPRLIVERDAGAGKSELIRDWCQVMDKEFRTAGNDPEQPYVLKGSFTGEAAKNIQGQTLTSLFSLSFGNKYTPVTALMQARKTGATPILKIPYHRRVLHGQGRYVISN